jgi:hypothetical protein
MDRINDAIAAMVGERLRGLQLRCRLAVGHGLLLPATSQGSHLEVRPVERSDSRRVESNSSEKVNVDGAPVAIIAIHGVGHHLSGVSADAVATLLQSLERSRTGKENNEIRTLSPPYSGFITTAIDVPLRPVQSPPEDATMANYQNKQSLISRIWGIFNERRGYLAATREEADFVRFGEEVRTLRPGEPDRGEYAYQFMLTQIAGYVGEPDRNFQTVRLEGKRNTGSSDAHVHIYDAHYSDLSKPESSILSFFLAFYQLLIHLASLSLQAVYWAEAENVGVKGPRSRWRIEASIHAASVRLLTMWVPFLNLTLLTIATTAFADKTHGWPPLPVVALGLAAILSAGATFWRIREAPSPRRPFLWAALPFVGTVVGTLALSGIGYSYNRIFDLQLSFWETLLVFGWLLAAGLVIAWIGKKFDPLRPGAFWVAVILYAANVSLFLFYLLPDAHARGAGESELATAALWAVQWIFGELLLSWIFCLLCALISWPLSALCVLGTRKDLPRKARAIAAFRTGRFAFAVPAILFVIVTCILWSGVVVYGSDKLKTFDDVSPTIANSGTSSQRFPSLVIPAIGPVEKWIDRTSGAAKETKCLPVGATGKTSCSAFWSSYLAGLLLVSVTPGLPITMSIFVVSLLLLTWAVLPSVIFEIKPTWIKNADSRHIRWLGEWFSRGIDNTGILTRLLWFAIVPVPLFFIVFDWLALHDNLPKNLLDAMDGASGFTLPLIRVGGLILAVSGLAVFGFILKYLTTVLDTILDVDNYLRTSPKEKAPRALIAERCTSLLRYVANFRDDQKRPYSKLIIVAHSLGSMVTTDLLRYLERSAAKSPDPGLVPYGFGAGHAIEQRKLPIYVFSMGSPLRQLLNRFFPHLYWWVSDIPDNSLQALSDPVGPPMPQIASPLPRSDEMNVALWVNAYRSGDYVGRYLWVGQWFNRNESGDSGRPPDIAHKGPPQACTEMCIGLGAHTHYWDRTAPEVAAWLDKLITG